LDRDLAERYGIEMIAPHAESAANPHRTVARCGGTAGVGDGTTLCLAASLSSVGHPLGVPRRELLRHGAPGLHANLAKAFMKRLLVPQRHDRINLHSVSGGDVASR
jgi:hypothetical protein